MNINNPYSVNETIAKLNNFLVKANDVISCGPSCQSEKKASDLKQKYLDAITNLETAPANVEYTLKNYMIFTEGDNAYNDYIDKQYEKEATDYLNNFKKTFDKNYDNTKRSIDSYNSLLTNFNNVKELNSKYESKNNNFERNKHKIIGDVKTNERKSYYENQALNNLYFYFKVIIVLYSIVVISYFICMFTITSNMTFIFRGLILLLLIIFPFVSMYISIVGLKIWRRFTQMLPKNIYAEI